MEAKWLDPNLTKEEAEEILNKYADPDREKIEVLKWFTKRDKVAVVKHLLDIGLFSMEELRSVKGRFIERKCSQAIYDYTWDYFNKLNDPDAIIAEKMPFSLTAGEDLFDKLVYYHEHNPKMYDELLKRCKGRHKTALHGELFRRENYKNNREVVVDLAMRYKDLENSNHFLGTLKKWQDEFSNEVLSEVQRRQKMIDYKELTNPERIMYRTDENTKWEALEYFAEKDPETFKKLVGMFTIRDKNPRRMGFMAEETIERYGDKEDLSPALAEYVNELKQRQIKKQQQKEERKTEIQQKRLEKQELKEKRIKDENEAKYLVKVGKALVVEEEDRKLLVDKFLESDLSINGFCRKYNVSDANTFKNVLGYVANQDEYYSARIAETLQRHKDEFLNNLKEGLKGVARNTKTIGELISENPSVTMEQYHQFAVKYFSQYGIDIIFADKVSKYYTKRIKEFSSGSVEGVNKALTRQEIKFIVGSDDYDKMLKGNDGVVDTKLRTLLKGCAVSSRKEINDCADMLKLYNAKFSKKEYFMARTFVAGKNGEQVEVSDAMVNEALGYARSKGLYTSNFVMRGLIGLIARGELDYSAEASQNLYAKRKEALALIEEMSSLDDYLSAIDALYYE